MKGLRFYRECRYVGVRFAWQARRCLEMHQFAPAFERLRTMPSAPTVVDVGANQGQFCRAVLAWRPSSRVHCLEPVPACREILLREFGGRSNVKVHSLALGDREGDLDFRQTPGSDGSSFHEPTPAMREAFPQLTGGSLIKAPTVKLATFLGRNGIARCDLLKLDVQGHEGPVLRDVAGCRKIIAAILVEVSFESLYEGDTPQGELIAHLQAAGFDLHCFTHFIHDPVSLRLLQADALLLNREWGLNPWGMRRQGSSREEGI